MIKIYNLENYYIKKNNDNTFKCNFICGSIEEIEQIIIRNTKFLFRALFSIKFLSSNFP